MTEKNEHITRLIEAIDAIVPGGLKAGDNWCDVAVELLQRAYPRQPGERAIADAIAEATANPGRTVEVSDQ